MFQQYFLEALAVFVPEEQARHSLWRGIEARYTDSSRHYHNLAHLDHITRELAAIRPSILRWDLVMLATAYHDAIYEAQNTDNEGESAALAREILSQYLPESDVSKVEEMILATKGHQHSDDPDTDYFTDADLAVLGCPPDDYLTYTIQIRAEYSCYVDKIYFAGRKAVLSYFLGQDAIYKTRHFAGLYERQARENLCAELAELEAAHAEIQL